MDHSKEMVRLAYEALSDKKGEDNASQYSVHNAFLNPYSILILLTCHADLE